MEAQTILKLIEAVDPADTAKLDEIDARVICFINQCEWKGDSSGFIPFVRNNQAFRYTRSRNALKAIRPEGWFIGLIRYTSTNTLSGDGGYECLLLKSGTPGFSSRHLVTEELAELHAIIQAIDSERNNATPDTE